MQLSYTSNTLTPLFINYFLQEIARGTGGGVDDAINLDIHAIDELQKKGIPPTNDKPKYKYTSDEQGNYGESEITSSATVWNHPCAW